MLNNPWFEIFLKLILTNQNPKIIFISQPNQESEVAKRLKKEGFKKSKGFLDGGINAWENEGFRIDRFGVLTMEELFADHENKF